MKKYLAKVAGLGFFTGAVLSFQSPAWALDFAGSDFTTNDAFRTDSVVKSLDSDGDNIYGTDGYTIFQSDAVGTSTSTNGNIVQTPSYANVEILSGLSYFTGNNSSLNYVDIDDPTQTGSGTVPNIESGILFKGGVGSGTTEFVNLNFTNTGNYRVGFLVDNTDFAAISPTSLTLNQTTGGSASVTTNLTDDRDLDGDYYFFDVDAEAGDVFQLSGVGDSGFGSNGIGGVTFDTIPAAPTPVPFGVSTDLSILILGGLFGASRLRKKLASK